MAKRHRRHSAAKRREVVEAYLNGEAPQQRASPVPFTQPCLRNR